MIKNRYVFSNAFIAALGGLLFGFDTAVISGAEQAIQDLFQLNGFWHGFTVAIALIGTVIGALIAGKPADRFGRKPVLIVLAFLYVISALGSALANSWIILLVFRFIGGIGVGASSVIGPMYIAEISPAKIRGRLVGMFQVNVVSGILLAFFSNYLVNQFVSMEQWRWMLGVEVVPALLFFILLFKIPPTPRWLVLKGQSEEAGKLLRKLGAEKPEIELNEIVASLKNVDNTTVERFFSRKYSFPIILAFLVAFFNQMSGINAIMYYAPRIFVMTGIAEDSALLQSVSIGVTNFVFTLLGMSIIDKVGRKKLLLTGAAGTSIFLALVALILLGVEMGKYMMVFCLIGYIAFFALSQGAVIWVYISEIFPNKVRANGQALGSFSHWFMAALVSWGFPIIASVHDNGGGIAFVVFTVFMAIQFFVVWKWFPETKGKSLEDIEHLMLKK